MDAAARPGAAGGSPAGGGAEADVGASRGDTGPGEGGGSPPEGRVAEPSEREGELERRLDEQLSRAGAMESRMAMLEAAEAELRERLRQEQASKERLQANHSRMLLEREDALRKQLQIMAPVTSRSREEDLTEVLTASEELHTALMDESARANGEKLHQQEALGAGTWQGARNSDTDFERLKARIAAMKGEVDGMSAIAGRSAGQAAAASAASVPSAAAASPGGGGEQSTLTQRHTGTPPSNTKTPVSAMVGQSGRPRSQSKVSWSESVVEKISGVQSFLSDQIVNLPETSPEHASGTPCQPLPAEASLSETERPSGGGLYPSQVSLESGPLPESVRRLRAMGAPRWAEASPDTELSPPPPPEDEALLEEAVLGFETLVASLSGKKAPRPPQVQRTTDLDRATERIGLALAGESPRPYNRRLTVLDDNVKAVAKQQELLLQMDHDSRDTFIHRNLDGIHRARPTVFPDFSVQRQVEAEPIFSSMEGRQKVPPSEQVPAAQFNESGTPSSGLTQRPLHRLPSPESVEFFSTPAAHVSVTPSSHRVYTPEDEIRALRHERDIFRNRARLAEERASKAKEDLTDVIDELLDAKADLEEERRRRAALLKDGLQG